MKEYGKYEHTFDELKHGAKMAWRNSNRCIGRLFWDSLHVVDKRQVETEDDISKSLLEHIKYATNCGKIRSTITVFKPESPDGINFRIINHQLLRYAGYKLGWEK
nr:nitric oxide synthase oxygenase [Bacillus alkalicellulosilyticus]